MKNLLILFAIVALCGCAPAHYYHLPNVLNVPAVQQKGDLEASGMVNSNYEWEAQASYGITDRVLILCNHQHMRKGSRPLESDWLKGQYTEFGTGYYHSKRKSTLNVSGLYGVGHILNNFSSGARAALDYARLMVQFGYIYRGNRFRFGAGLRTGQVRITGGELSLSAPFAAIEGFETLKKHRNVAFLGLGFSAGIGRDPLMLNAFAALDRSFIHLKDRYWGAGQVGVGLTFVLETQKKRKKKDALAE